MADADGASSQTGDADGTSSQTGDADGTSSQTGDADGTSSQTGDADGTSSQTGDADGTSSQTGDADGTSDQTANAGGASGEAAGAGAEPDRMAGAEGTAVPPGSGWPDDPATTATPVAHSADEVGELARSAATMAELAARQSVCRACPRLVSWREQTAAVKRRSLRAERYWAGRCLAGATSGRGC